MSLLEAAHSTFDLIMMGVRQLDKQQERKPAVSINLSGSDQAVGQKMQRPISSLPLSSSWLAKLASCGFETVEDLRNIGVVELSRGKYKFFTASCNTICSL